MAFIGSQSFSSIKCQAASIRRKKHWNLYLTAYVPLKNNLDQALLRSASSAK